MEAKTIFHPEVQEKLPLFLQAWWLDLLAPDKWVYFTDAVEGEEAIIWPVILQKKWGIQIGTMTPITQYLGPYQVKGRMDDAALAFRTAQIHQQYIAKAVVTIKQSMQLSPVQALALSEQGWQFQERITYRIKTSTIAQEGLWAGLNSTRRNLVRHAEKELFCSEGEFNSQIDAIFRQTYRYRNSKLPFSAQVIESISKQTVRNNRGFMLHAVRKMDEKILAYGFFAHDTKYLYYLVGGADRIEDPKGLAGSIILWNGILRAKALGLDFDFEGSMNPGIAKFFKSFGGQSHSYWNGTWDRWPVLRKITRLSRKKAD